MRRNLLLHAVAFSAMLSFPSSAHCDPAPAEALAAIEGASQGKLEYRDNQPPNKIATLPTGLFVAPHTQGVVPLNYVFDDGPKKAVHSYGRMQIDFDKKTFTFSGLKPEGTTVSAITSS